jgi:predicted nucleic acid-binding protein
MNAVDTNVFIYSIDARDPIKQTRAISIIESLPVDSRVMPWQVACEIAAALRTMTALGKFTGNYPETVRALRSCFPILPPTHDILEHALDLQIAHQLSVWDALLLGACSAAGVKRLYTEELQSTNPIDGVQLINPFAC